MSDFRSIVIDGRQLRAARIIAGLTTRDMAAAAGLNRNTIQRVEALESLPFHAGSADRIAATLQSLGIIFTATDGKAGVSFPAANTRKRRYPLPL